MGLDYGKLESQAYMFEFNPPDNTDSGGENLKTNTGRGGHPITMMLML